MTDAPDMEQLAKFTSCSVANCPRNAHYKAKGSHGWCRAHYLRWRRYGDPLGGRKTLEGDHERFFKEVVLTYDGDLCQTWPFSRNGDGYAQISSKGKNYKVCRLVCEHVHGPAPTSKHHAAHSCGKGHLGCVNKRHLSWKTPAENKADQIRHGTWAHGANHGSAKITLATAVEVALARIRGESFRSLADRFGCTEGLPRGIANGSSWPEAMKLARSIASGEING